MLNVKDMYSNSNCAYATEIDTKNEKLTDLIYETCYSAFGKTVTVDNLKASDVPKQVPWFDEDCRATKATFVNAKRVIRGSTTGSQYKIVS